MFSSIWRAASCVHGYIWTACANHTFSIVFRLLCHTPAAVSHSPRLAGQVKLAEAYWDEWDLKKSQTGFKKRGAHLKDFSRSQRLVWHWRSFVPHLLPLQDNIDNKQEQILMEQLSYTSNCPIQNSVFFPIAWRNQHQLFFLLCSVIH